MAVVPQSFAPQRTLSQPQMLVPYQQRTLSGYTPQRQVTPSTPTRTLTANGKPQPRYSGCFVQKRVNFGGFSENEEIKILALNSIAYDVTIHESLALTVIR